MLSFLSVSLILVGFPSAAISQRVGSVWQSAAALIMGAAGSHCGVAISDTCLLTHRTFGQYFFSCLFSLYQNSNTIQCLYVYQYMGSLTYIVVLLPLVYGIQLVNVNIAHFHILQRVTTYRCRSRTSQTKDPLCSKTII